MKHVFSSPYYPRDSGHIENACNFLKACIQKHVSTKLAWDEVAHIACAACNFVPNGHSEVSAFFLMLERDASKPLLK